MGATIVRSEVGACDLLLTELRATDTKMYANFTRVSPAEWIFCCVRTESKIRLWSVAQAYRPTTAHEASHYSAVPRHLSTGHACRQGDVIGCNNFSS